MLRSIDEVRGYALKAVDGEIGRCKDFLFDDEQWTIRYMVADTGKWIPGRQVLISPMSLRDPDWSSRNLPVDLTKKQVEEAPPLKDDEPVSRQHEVRLHTYYGYPYYWIGAGVWGLEATPEALRAAAEEGVTVPPEPEGDPHLRSIDEVEGYRIQASDGEIGHVEDLIVDDETWTLRYLVVDTRNWLPGRKVLVSPSWVDDIDALQAKTFVDLTKDQVENSPEYDPRTPINRDYEVRLYDFYGRPAYWR
jgi:hypothetical protein